MKTPTDRRVAVATKTTTTASASQKLREVPKAYCGRCHNLVDGETMHDCTIPAEKPTLDDAMLLIAEYDELKAHADKLAEALSLAQATIERLRLKYDLGSVWGTLDVTQKALAAYESEVQP